ncbi:Multisubstrate pseudouridine synthase 7 [Diplonema papillatum]|nr:Multisubstrate pseudouridine synthase 7 [Diplonema papillatum]
MRSLQFVRIGGVKARWASGVVPHRDAAAAGDSELNEWIEAQCGMEYKMVSQAPPPIEAPLPGKALSACYDQVVHEIKCDGTDATLRFCPSYSDAMKHGPVFGGAKPPRKGTHLHFNLYTEGISTQAAVKRMSDHLGIPLRNFSVASLKDAHCASTQAASVEGCSWRQLSLVNDMFELKKDMKVGDFETKSAPVQLGNCLGNRFDVVIRHVSGAYARSDDGTLETELSQRLRWVKSHGFVNYVGYQRFALGGRAQPYDIAAGMLAKDWLKSIHALFGLRRNVADQVLPLVTQRQYEKALDALRRLTDDAAEGESQQPAPPPFYDDVLVAMAATGDARGVLSACVPRVVKAHCLASLQSVLYNKMASRRLRRHGIQVAVGDTVAPLDHTGFSADDVSVVRSAAEAKQYSIRDVVLPLLGVQRSDDNRPVPTTYPEAADIDRAAHEELLRSLGLSLDVFEEATGDAAIFHGHYRHVWASCGNLQAFSLPAVTPDDTTPILVTDNMVMERTHFNLKLTPLIASEEFMQHFAEGSTTQLRPSEYPYGAHVLLSAVFPTNVYPAMFLREVAPDVALRTLPGADQLI